MPKKLFRPWKCTRKNTKRKNSVRSLSEEENSSRSSSNGSVRDEKVCSSSSISECEDSTMGSLDRLSRFVFNGTVDLPRPESSNASENSPRSTVTPDTVPISAFRPVYQYPMNFMPFDYSNPLGLGMGLGPSDNQAVVEAAAAMATSVVAGSHAHSGIYGLPALPLGSYGARVAEAICLQDAVAKQRKKQRPKKFTCEFCNAAFSNNGQLKGHIRIHTGERPFVCGECNKSFTRNEELTRHQRIHSGDRPYGCDVCHKHFGRKDHLRKHCLIHTRRAEIMIPPIIPPHLYIIPPYIY